MHSRSYVVALVGLALGLSACSVNTLGTSAGSDAADESQGSEAADEIESSSGESGSASADGTSESTTSTSTDTMSSSESDTANCPQGAQGCPCTGGGGCDPGLMCEADLCVPVAGDTTTTDTTSTTDTTTTTGGGDPLTCDLDNNCPVPDLDTCVCVGCNTNGYCTQSDDCVCPDCANADVCTNNCTNDGSCNPYYEGCDCSDCAAHPLCG